MILLKKMETDIIKHCNLTCKECAHHSPFLEKGVYDLDIFEKDVSIISNFLHTKEFVILGGEPLLNTNILKYAQILKKYNLCDKISLQTNGLLFLTINPDLDIFDEIIINLYSSLKKSIIENIKNKTRKLTNVKYVEKNQFWNCFKISKSDKIETLKTWNNCGIKIFCNVIYNGYFCKCIMNFRKYEFLKSQNIKEDIEYLNNYETSAVNLYSNNLKEKLETYMNRNIPIEACQWCTGTSGKLVEHKQY